MYSGTQLFLIYSGLFFAALVFSLLIFSLFMRFARTLGIREKDQMLVRWSSRSKPAFGGIGFFILFLVSFTLHGVHRIAHQVLQHPAEQRAVQRDGDFGIRGMHFDLYAARQARTQVLHGITEHKIDLLRHEVGR